LVEFGRILQSNDTHNVKDNTTNTFTETQTFTNDVVAPNIQKFSTLTARFGNDLVAIPNVDTAYTDWEVTRTSDGFVQEGSGFRAQASGWVTVSGLLRFTATAGVDPRCQGRTLLLRGDAATDQIGETITHGGYLRTTGTTDDDGSTACVFEGHFYVTANELITPKMSVSYHGTDSVNKIEGYSGSEGSRMSRITLQLEHDS
jgi:hypothetical protein